MLWSRRANDYMLNHLDHSCSLKLSFWKEKTHRDYFTISAVNLCISTWCLQLVDLYIEIYSEDWPPPFFFLFMNCKEIIIFINLFTVQNFCMNNLWQHCSLRIVLSVHNKYLLDGFILKVVIRLAAFLFPGWLSLSLLITSASRQDDCLATE